MALTKQDLSQVKEIVEEVVERVVERVIVQEVERIVDEKTKHLPTRKEFLDNSAQIMGELQEIRNEMVVITGKNQHHEERIDNLERIHSHGQHQAI